MKSHDERRRTREEQQELNADLSYEEEGTYGCRGSPRFSGRFRVMQRPRTTTTRSSVAAAAAAEFELLGDRGRRRRREEWLKARRAGLFIRASS